MGFSLKKILKPALAIGAGFVANKFLPGSGKFVGKAVSSLMGGYGGHGGDWSPVDTSVQAQNYGGRLGFDRMADASKGDRMVSTSDGEELRNEWDYRLTKWFRNKDQMFT
tara:strand:+ start:282 stop:611 length:330 start_codon:yes stop_codon:yes gene_type:complete